MGKTWNNCFQMVENSKYRTEIPKRRGKLKRALTYTSFLPGASYQNIIRGRGGQREFSWPCWGEEMGIKFGEAGAVGNFGTKFLKVGSHE